MEYQKLMQSLFETAFKPRPTLMATCQRTSVNYNNAKGWRNGYSAPTVKALCEALENTNYELRIELKKDLYK